uniref:Synuclein, alpha interacting protein n=1 Tax=Hippocampus comes TaxID=109280 RepID=A0A3Q2XZC9_HIPCM
MEVPEYLDLDEIDFSDDAVYSVSSLKNIPELSRRNDAQAEERAASPGRRQPFADPRRGGQQPPACVGVSGPRRVSPASHVSDGRGRAERAQPDAAHARRPRRQGSSRAAILCFVMCVVRL